MWRSRRHDPDDELTPDSEQALTTQDIRRADAGRRVVEAENQARDRKNEERLRRQNERAKRKADQAQATLSRGAGAVFDPHSGDLERAYEAWKRTQESGGGE